MGFRRGRHYQRRRFLSCALLATGLFLAIKLSYCVIFLQTKNQSPGKVKIRIILDEKSGLETLIASITQQKNIIETITIRDLKKGKIEVNLKMVVRKNDLPNVQQPFLSGTCRAIALEH
jgi:putative Mg2+ transporter-C (MgtC) family protein